MSGQGVDTVFSLSGNQIMPLYDAFIDEDIRLVHTRHEAAAVFMADAFAQATQSTGVVLVTAAPGFGNALGALYSARMAESAVVFLSGDSPVSQDGRGAFQEFSQVEAAKPFVKWSERVVDASKLADTFVEACAVAQSGRRGPVHLALPFDVLNGEVDTAPLDVAEESETDEHVASFIEIEHVLGLLAKSKRPIILSGPDLSRSRTGTLLDDLSEAIHVPIVAMESPRGLKDPALGALADILPEADTVFYLGKRIDFTVGFGDAVNASTIMIVDAEEAVLEAADSIYDGSVIAFSVCQDPHSFAMQLLHKSQNVSNSNPERDSWCARVEEMLGLRIEADAGSRISPSALASAVNQALAKASEPILICDGGEFGQWAQAFASSPIRIINGPSGAIGGSLPFAIGAKIARPNSTVIAMMGDGTVGFHLSEFETAAREGVAFVAVIGNDGRWNAEHLIQVRDYGPDRTFACDLSRDARYDQAAVALGCFGQHVTQLSEIESALDAAIASGKPACIDVSIEGLPAPVVVAK